MVKFKLKIKLKFRLEIKLKSKLKMKNWWIGYWRKKGITLIRSCNKRKNSLELDLKLEMFVYET